MMLSMMGAVDPMSCSERVLRIYCGYVNIKTEGLIL